MPVSYKSAMGINSAHNLTLDRAVILRGTRIICRDLSFTLPAGGRLWLRGSNGSGKSTLLRALAGLLPLTSGAVCLGETKLQAGIMTMKPYGQMRLQREGLSGLQLCLTPTDRS